MLSGGSFIKLIVETDTSVFKGLVTRINDYLDYSIPFLTGIPKYI